MQKSNKSYLVAWTTRTVTPAVSKGKEREEFADQYEIFNAAEIHGSAEEEAKERYNFLRECAEEGNETIYCVNMAEIKMTTEHYSVGSSKG